MPFQIVKPVIDFSVRNLCYHEYYNHPKGCPNYGKRAKCPPQRKTIDKIIDLNSVVYAIWNVFDFKRHCWNMESLHPEWSERQVQCCLYWQGGARKLLKAELIKFLHSPEGRGLHIVSIPEATGVNVTATMNGIGIRLEWPPVNVTYQIALAGKRIIRKVHMSCSLKKWFNDLTWMKQGVLISCIRNCDGVISEGPYKVLARGVRGTCIKSAQTKDSFNARRPNPNKLLKAAADLCEDYLDHLPIHFVAHLIHASEVIGYSHPDNNIANTWLKIYKMIVHELHLNVETLHDFQVRLSDDLEQVKRENEYDEKCYQTKNYGDNIGIINE